MDKKFEEQKTKDNDKNKDDFHDFEKEEFEEIEENGEIILVCRKCVKFAREAHVDLKKIFKGNYGRIKAPNTGDRNKDKERRKRKLADAFLVLRPNREIERDWERLCCRKLFEITIF